MKNYHDLLSELFDSHIQLSDEQRTKMRNRKNINRKRLNDALGKQEPLFWSERIMQGSYAMNTMVQTDVDMSDIDDAVVFEKSELVGPRGSEYTALEARNFVKAMLTDNKFSNEPELHTNCVRICYKDEGVIDVPVYRRTKKSDNVFEFELASSEWIKADPNATVHWFKEQVASCGEQLRRMVKLVKAWSKSRSSWNMPSGYFLTILVWEAYSSINVDNERDDQTMYKVLRKLQTRLVGSLVLSDPKSGNTVTKTKSEAKMVFLLEQLPSAIEKLERFSEQDCTEVDAMKVYDDLFNTKFFAERIAAAQKASPVSGFTVNASGNPERVIKSQTGNTFA